MLISHHILLDQIASDRDDKKIMPLFRDIILSIWNLSARDAVKARGRNEIVIVERYLKLAE